MDAPRRSPRWSATAKLVVALVIIAFAGLVLFRFSEVIPPLVIAVMFAFILNPPVTFIAGRLKISRALAVGIIYLALLLALAGLSTALGFAIRRQIVQLDANVDIRKVIADVPRQVDSLVHGQTVVGPITVIFDKAERTSGPAQTPFVVDLSGYDLAPLYQQAVTAIEPALKQTGSILGGFASAAAATLGWALFVLVIGFYMLLDAPQLGQSLHDLAFPGYEADVQRIFQELNLIWSAFLRGQVILALIIGAMVTVTMTALGLRSAVIVGLIGATLELIPTVGPTISATIGVGVALFQPSNPFGLSTVWYAVVVLIAYLVIQQIENTVIVPRVIGRSLHLHPLAVLIAAVMGATLAGILGLMLAAPMLATLRLFSRYAYRKFFDLDPWPDPLPVPEKNKPLFRWPFAKKKDVAPLNAPRVDYSYRIFWTKAAREWDADRRRAIAEALAAVMTRPDFEPNDYERRYQVPGLDEPAHSGQSLIALATVLRAFDTKTTDR